MGIRAPLRICDPGRALRSSAFTVNEYGKLATFFSPSYSVKTTWTRSGVTAGVWSSGFAAVEFLPVSCAAAVTARANTNPNDSNKFFFIERLLYFLDFKKRSQ